MKQIMYSDKLHKTLLHAVVTDDIAGACLLIDIGKYSINEANWFKQTPLMLAAHYRRIELMKLLIKHGADITLRDYDGDTAIIYAVSKRNYEAIKVLLAHGAEPNPVSSCGQCPLREALNMNWSDGVKILMAAIITRFGIAMAPLNLPAYVTYWILEFVETEISNHEKMAIEILQRIRDRYRRKI